MQSRIIVYSPHITNRLRYIADELLCRLGGLSVEFTTDAEHFRRFNGARINYTDTVLDVDALHISPASVLFENGIQPQRIPVEGTGTNTVLYPRSSGNFPFDIFAAAFYLISRYEEYLPHKTDEYGRFTPQDSMAFKNGFLKIPIVDQWMEVLKNALTALFPELCFTARSFRFTPTYDIDMAYSYRFKGWWRNAGGFCRSLLTGDIAAARERAAVLGGQQADPFDAFNWLHDLHGRFALQPLYFFLVAQQKGRYDKNIAPTKPVMQHLIRSHSERYTIGLHPSWASGNDTRLAQQEKNLLESLAGRTIINSRQHYLRVQWPHTYRQLLRAGITHDFSMGYAGMNGFRASVTSDFHWYDLEKEVVTPLLIHPFCFMDATAYYYQKMSPALALEELLYFFNIISNVSGSMITIFHNSLLGPGCSTTAWRDMYARYCEIVQGNIR